MKSKLVSSFVVCGLMSVAAFAAGPNATRISLAKLHCAGCARKIGAKLYEKPGVTRVEYDLKAKFIVVTPQSNTQLSPRMLWECVEQTPGCPDQGGYQPLKLEGPQGVFTQKPPR